MLDERARVGHELLYPRVRENITRSTVRITQVRVGDQFEPAFFGVGLRDFVGFQSLVCLGRHLVALPELLRLQHETVHKRPERHRSRRRPRIVAGVAKVCRRVSQML